MIQIFTKCNFEGNFLRNKSNYWVFISLLIKSFDWSRNKFAFECLFSGINQRINVFRMVGVNSWNDYVFGEYWGPWNVLPQRINITAARKNRKKYLIANKIPPKFTFLIIKLLLFHLLIDSSIKRRKRFPIQFLSRILN